MMSFHINSLYNVIAWMDVMYVYMYVCIYVYIYVRGICMY